MIFKSDVQTGDTENIKVNDLITEVSDVRIIDLNEPSSDDLEEAFEVMPLTRSLIDDSNLPTPDKEFFLDEEEQNHEDEKGDDDSEEPSCVCRDVMRKFEHDFDNHTCKEIINNSFKESILIFEILAVNGTKIHLLFSVLKQDYLHDFSKSMSCHVTEGRRIGAKPHNLWETSFLKQHKRNFYRSHTHWGFRHPKFVVTPKRSRSVTIKNKVKNHVRDHFGFKMPRSTSEELIIDKNNGRNFQAETTAKERTALIEKGVLMFHTPIASIEKPFQ